jgi:hypothetical protein
MEREEKLENGIPIPSITRSVAKKSLSNQFNDIVLTSAKTSSFCPCLYPLDQ